jgi:NAD(P)-dependent dehydrogenase (short-subunit alcohol dehydrogenase family)
MHKDVEALFDLSGRVAVITGGCGLLGYHHAEIIAAAGGTPVLLDLAVAGPAERAETLATDYGVPALGIVVDITRSADVQVMLAAILDRFGRVDILINNAANNPKVESAGDAPWSRLENFPLDVWEADLAVGLTGAFLCSQVIGAEMARRGRGVILNIASDLAVIGPDQRLYRQDDAPSSMQPVKPVTYSVVKTALLGLTRYLATYWADAGIRVNAISPGGVANGQSDEFVTRLSALIPLSRMARVDEYKGAILFLCSDASSYMTGANLVIDGGRSTW